MGEQMHFIVIKSELEIKPKNILFRKDLFYMPMYVKAVDLPLEISHI